jgi:pectate lyase-like protein
MAYTIPSDTHVVNDTGHTTDHNNIVDVLKSGIAVNVLNTAYAGGADPTGVGDSTAAIQAAITAACGGHYTYTAQAGGFVYLPTGKYVISKTLIIPSCVTLAGAGWWNTTIQLATNSGCDVIQFSTYNSSSQATILGISAGSIGNAFYAGIRDIAIHGDAFTATAAAYYHGINQTTNPLTSTAGGDPEFDPLNLISNVVIKACTGDGYYNSGRSGNLVHRVNSNSHNGNGFSSSFDTTFLDCLAAFNEVCGFYLAHASDTGAGCKSYNNGEGVAWVSGFAYTVNYVVIYSNVLYFCISAVTSSTPPPSDPTHWTALSATSAAAWGTGWFFDSGANEQAWAGCDAQENGTNGITLSSCQTVSFQGTVANPNYNNGTNPSGYAAVLLSGCSGCNVSVTAKGMSATQAYALSVQSSAVNNNLTIATDGTEYGVFAPSSGTANHLTYNGMTALGESSTAQSITGNGQTINTAGLGLVRVTASSAYTGAILQAGTLPGQQVWVVNEGTATITFNTTPATAHIAGSAGTIALAANTSAYLFVWDAGTSLWYKTT